ncbi:MAG: 30S ribosomal protein S12 methylthiotransferase RimO [Clostridiaceae bacterium]|nr:30S ribosomal protein S12 methylthiotransferase RimO [Clostridiaceae bacterium]
MNQKVGLVSLGCPKNLVDSEIMLGTLKEAGYELIGEHENADVIIVNTCAFIGDAKEEAIMSILEAARYKKEGNLKLLVVTGCLAERYKTDIYSEIPEVDVVVGTGSIDEIPGIIEKTLLEETNEKKVYANTPNTVDYLELTRLVTDEKPYGYLKIAEGCSNRCTYCIIPSLRGDYRSRTIENILKEAKLLAQKGKKEIILIAQDVTRYGTDIYNDKKLVELIRQISNIEEVERIRLLYCYPELIDENLILEMKNNPKLCKYLDIPIQHISDNILKSMGRRGNKSYIYNLLEEIREQIPGVVIRTSLITGFPGETEEDFTELYDFVKESNFEHLGVFAYSKEEGTPAYKMKGHLPQKLKNERRDKLMVLQMENVEKYNSSRLGRIYDTIVDGVADDGIFYVGRTYAEAPDIDSVIYFTSTEPMENGMIVPVKILCPDGYDLVGEVQDITRMKFT